MFCARPAALLTLRSWTPRVSHCSPFAAMSDEVAKAQVAAAVAQKNGAPPEKTVFGKMLDGEIPCKFIYEDEQCVAFDDIAPTAPVHFLVIPRKAIASLDAADSAIDAELLGHLMLTAKKVATEIKGLSSGYRLVVNNGREGCQSVYHLHIHCIGGKQLSWPPGC